MQCKAIFKTMFFLFFLAVLTISSHPESSIREYTILNHGTLILNIPETWKEIELIGSPNQPSKIKYFANGGEINISYHWNLTQISNTNATQISLNRLKMAGESLLNRSLEKSLKIKHFKTGKDQVFYFTLTDKRDLKKGFKYLTHGSTNKGNLILLVTVFSHSSGHPNIKKSLDIIGNADFIFNRSKK